MNARRWLIASRGICGGVCLGNLATLPARDPGTVRVALALVIAAGFGWTLFDRELRRLAREENEP